VLGRGNGGWWGVRRRGEGMGVVRKVGGGGGEFRGGWGG